MPALSPEVSLFVQFVVVLVLSFIYEEGGALVTAVP